MHTIKNILCPVDFSEKSGKMIEKAAFFARLHQADLTLVHVVSNMTAYMGSLYGFDSAANPEWFFPVTEQAKERARELLRDLKQQFVPYAVTCKSSIRYGNIRDEILEEAKELNANLIILATHSNDDLLNLPLGNTVNDIISRAGCPVLTFREMGEEKGFGKILIPVDITYGISELIDYIVDYFDSRDPEIQLINMVDTKHADDLGFISRIENYLGKFRDEIKKRGFNNTSLKVISGKNPGASINDYAVAGNFQLIMMNTHGRSGLENLIMGSVTHHVVSRSRIPVFTFRGKNIDEM
ncbi:MAG: universal stress protein [Bacteroidia bacterium]|nr:universal stress protein [Bacteroidia bacterium]